MHDRAIGTCHAEISCKGIHGMREWVSGNCRRYTGPTPLEEVFTSPILPPESCTDRRQFTGSRREHVTVEAPNVGRRSACIGQEIR